MNKLLEHLKNYLFTIFILLIWFSLMIYAIIRDGGKEIAFNGFFSYSTLIISLVTFYIGYIFFIATRFFTISVKGEKISKTHFLSILISIVLFAFIFVLPELLISYGDYDVFYNVIILISQESLVQYTLTFISIGIIGSSLMLVSIGFLMKTEISDFMKAPFYFFSMAGVLSFIYCSIISSLLILESFNEGYFNAWLFWNALDAIFWGCVIFFGWIIIWYIASFPHFMKFGRD